MGWGLLGSAPSTSSHQKTLIWCVVSSKFRTDGSNKDRDCDTSDLLIACFIPTVSVSVMLPAPWRCLICRAVCFPALKDQVRTYCAVQSIEKINFKYLWGNFLSETASAQTESCSLIFLRAHCWRGENNIPHCFVILAEISEKTDREPDTNKNKHYLQFKWDNVIYFCNLHENSTFSICVGCLLQ